MNELIRKFERQSHLDVYSLGKDRAKWESVVVEFAELIVQECANIAYDTCWNDYEKVREMYIKDAIKGHFGVE